MENKVLCFILVACLLETARRHRQESAPVLEV